MYLPSHFEENRPEVLIQYIEKTAFGSLMTNVDGEIEANHLPFLYDSNEHMMLAHISKENPLYTLLKQPRDVLIVFHVDHAYVSPNWYAGKLEHHKTVPTWNYVVIHVKGVAHIIEDQRKLRGILAKLTRQHESNQPVPWKMTDAPADFIAEEMSQIVGIQIEIKHMVGKFKLSQNRSSQDAKNVAEAFLSQGRTELNALMQSQINTDAQSN
ncbi:MAG: FMN-binding negative transcriptional regulator [Candidatus Acinetobacter avistercoris]|uniref:FMN-binding negative transcriptional regulator n=1 Tax=Acinetobacter sp. KS-LM10 TaxID=3120518 RepID=UPI001F8920F3|nr:FMN-binding negative transcriptional regulator [Candidatus Acinetobacter avistercoris]